MAIGRITGSVLKSNLTRNGTDLAFETNLLYLDVTNSRVGIGTSEPTTALQVNGTTTTAGLTANGAVNIDGTGTSNMDNIIIGANTAAAITGTTVDGTIITASTNFVGALTGNVTGNASGTAATVTTAAQTNITSLGTLTALTVDNINLNGNTIVSDTGTLAIDDNTTVNGSLTATTLVGTLSTAAQPNITSLGTLTTLDVNGTVTTTSLAVDSVTITDNTVSTNASNSNLELSGNGTGSITFNSAYTFPTADGNNGQVLQTDGDGNITFAESGGGGGGNNTAVKQINYYKLGTSSAVIDEFDLTEYRGAIYDISMDDHVNSLVGHVKVSIVHNGSTPYILVYDLNEDSTNVCNFTAAISGTKLQLSANTNSSTNTDVRMRRVALGDHHETVANTNSKIVASSTAISSSATVLDQFTKTDLQSAKYVVLFKDTTQNEYQISEVSMVHNGTTVFFNDYGRVSTRADFPFSITATISGATVNVYGQSAGGTTATVILYRLDLGSKTKFGNFDDTEFKKIHDQDSTVATVDEFDLFKYDTARYFISIANANDTEYQNSEIVLTTNSAKTDATISETVVRTGTTTMATFTADVSSGKVRLRMQGTSANNVVYIARMAMEKELIHYASDHTSNDVFIKANNLVVNDTATEFKVDKITQSSHSNFVSRQYVLFGTTTNNTETEIFVGGVSDSRIPVTTNSTMNYTLDITARRTDADGYSAGYQLKGVVDNNSGTVADVGDVYEIIIAEDDSALTIDATADNTNKSLKVTVTGQSGHTYKWMCAVKTYEVIE